MAEQRTVSEEQARALRKRYPYALENSWVGRVARERGWQEANALYLRGEQRRSTGAMRALMREAGVTPECSPEDALSLIALACEVFAPEDGFTGEVTRASDTALRIASPNCPAYADIETREWQGVTACPSWHRRRGWLDALHVTADDSMVHEKKWGDEACVAVIEIDAGVATR